MPVTLPDRQFTPRVALLCIGGTVIFLILSVGLPVSAVWTTTHNGGLTVAAGVVGFVASWIGLFAVSTIREMRRAGQHRP